MSVQSRSALPSLTVAEEEVDCATDEGATGACVDDAVLAEGDGVGRSVAVEEDVGATEITEFVSLVDTAAPS